jgi:hypothetical protein
MKKIYLLLLFSAFVACKSANKSQNIIPITGDNLTDYNVYLDNLGKYDDDAKSKANGLVKEAQSLDNQADKIAKTMELYQQSISVYPTAEAYLGFSKAVAAQNGSIDKVLGALQMAERLNYQPAEELYYEAAKQMLRFDTLLKMQECNGTGDCINKAIKLGFKDVSRMKKEFISSEVFGSNHVKKNYLDNDFIQSFLKIVPQNTKQKEVCELLNLYHKTENLPFAIDEKNIAEIYNTAKHQYLPYALIEYLPNYQNITSREKYSEMPSPYPITKFEFNKNFVAYLCLDDHYTSAYFHIITYNKDGKFISSKEVAKFSREELQTMTISDKKIDIKKYTANITVNNPNSEVVTLTITNKEFKEATFFSFTENGELK